MIHLSQEQKPEGYVRDEAEQGIYLESRTKKAPKVEAPPYVIDKETQAVTFNKGARVGLDELKKLAKELE